MVKHRFTLKSGNASEREEDVDNGLDEDEQIEWDEMFIEIEASKHIQGGDVAVFKTGDDHSYYFLKIISPFETKAETTGDYRHTFPLAHRVMEGHCLEIYKETNDGTLYYIDNTRKALISAFCVVGNCPELPSSQ